MTTRMEIAPGKWAGHRGHEWRVVEGGRAVAEGWVGGTRANAKRSAEACIKERESRAKHGERDRMWRAAIEAQTCPCDVAKEVRAPPASRSCNGTCDALRALLQGCGS